MAQIHGQPESVSGPIWPAAKGIEEEAAPKAGKMLGRSLTRQGASRHLLKGITLQEQGAPAAPAKSLDKLSLKHPISFTDQFEFVLDLQKVASKALTDVGQTFASPEAPPPPPPRLSKEQQQALQSLKEKPPLPYRATKPAASQARQEVAQTPAKQAPLKPEVSRLSASDLAKVQAHQKAEAFQAQAAKKGDAPKPPLPKGYADNVAQLDDIQKTYTAMLQGKTPKLSKQNLVDVWIASNQGVAAKTMPSFQLSAKDKGAIDSLKGKLDSSLPRDAKDFNIDNVMKAVTSGGAQLSENQKNDIQDALTQLFSFIKLEPDTIKADLQALKKCQDKMNQYQAEKEKTSDPEEQAKIEGYIKNQNKRAETLTSKIKGAQQRIRTTLAENIARTTIIAQKSEKELNDPFKKGTALERFQAPLLATHTALTRAATSAQQKTERLPPQEKNSLAAKMLSLVTSRETLMRKGKPQRDKLDPEKKLQKISLYMTHDQGLTIINQGLQTSAKDLQELRERLFDPSVHPHTKHELLSKLNDTETTQTQNLKALTDQISKQEEKLAKLEQKIADNSASAEETKEKDTLAKDLQQTKNKQSELSDTLAQIASMKEKTTQTILDKLKNTDKATIDNESFTVLSLPTANISPEIRAYTQSNNCGKLSPDKQKVADSLIKGSLPFFPKADILARVLSKKIAQFLFKGGSKEDLRKMIETLGYNPRGDSSDLWWGIEAEFEKQGCKKSLNNVMKQL